MNKVIVILGLLLILVADETEAGDDAQIKGDIDCCKFGPPECCFAKNRKSGTTYYEDPSTKLPYNYPRLRTKQLLQYGRFFRF